MFDDVAFPLLESCMEGYNGTIFACEKGNRWEEALSSLREMIDRLLTPDMVQAAA